MLMTSTGNHVPHVSLKSNGNRPISSLCLLDSEFFRTIVQQLSHQLLSLIIRFSVWAWTVHCYTMPPVNNVLYKSLRTAKVH